MQINNETKADILVQALPYIKKYTGEIIVVKYGGNPMSDQNVKAGVMKDIVLLHQIGVKVVLVHGGSSEIEQVMNSLNVKQEYVDGIKKTDAQTMEIVQMVLSGKVNKNLVNLIELAGGNAVGLCGIDGHMIESAPIGKETGYTGTVTKVNVTPLVTALNSGAIPVISPIGFDQNGNVYSICADLVAARLAGELKAKCLINMTDQKGILRDKNDQSSLIPVLNVSEAPRLVKEGIIYGGMISKVECCVEAIRRGVKQVFIIDGTVLHSILIEILSDEGIGTMFI